MTRPDQPQGWATVSWLLFLAATLWALLRLGDVLPFTPPAGRSVTAWLEQEGPAVPVMGLVRVGALALAGHLMVMGLLGVACRALGWWHALRLVEALVPHLARKALGLSLGVTVAIAPAPALAGATTGATAAAGTTAAAATTDEVAAGRDEAITMRRLLDGPPGAPASPPAPATGTGTRTWTIEPGQHLWSIAEALVTEHLGRTPTDAQIDPYWRRLVDVNRSRLADPATPDLVYPGQILEVPAALPDKV